MDNFPLCQYLDWDSTFFNLRIARVKEKSLNEETASLIDRWCGEQKIDCLYFLTEGSDIDSILLAESYGYHFTDIRVVFEKQFKLDSIHAPVDPAVVFRPAVEEDIPFLKKIAKVSFRATRFYRDRNFPRDLCDALYETWIEKSYNGYSDMVTVAECDSELCGFIACKKIDAANGEIGLIGVDSNSQGRGIGQLLVNESLGWFAERSIGHITVTTQGSNFQAQRLYERCGFLTQSVNIWYHKWFR